MSPKHARADKRAGGLSVVDGVAFVVGIVVGAGIFKTPAIVAANSAGGGAAMLAWIAGGLVSLVGALCYTELAAAYPHRGGDYHFLSRAFGAEVAFLFAWSRMTVVQTGSIAMHAFLIGDYASQIARLGPHSNALYALVVVGALTAANIAGLKQGRRIQKVLTGALVVGLALVIAAGLALAGGAAPTPPRASGAPSLGLAMIFVLLTYGGWNEAAYLSAELRGGSRSMLRVLGVGLAVITALYLLANLAYLHGLGFAGVAASEAPAAALMRHALGDRGAALISLLIVLAALSGTNATIFTGARTNWAFGRDFALFRALGRWSERADAPVNALVAQGLITLALVGLGTLTRDGFTTMVEFTAPVFWLFFLLVGVALFVLRRRDAAAPRPFRVPLYPLTPALFCLVAALMLRASVAYTGLGALVGVGVLLSGVPFLVLAIAAQRRVSSRGEGST